MVKDFPQTTWGLVCRIRDPGLEAYRSGVETLCRRYWEPINQYVCAALASNDADAQDLTQEFFLWILEGDGQVLRRFAPDRGSFRHYLKGLLRNFTRNARKAARRLKRGGGRVQVALDEAVAEDPGDLGAAESAFDRAWANEVTRRAVAGLRERYEKTDRLVQWQVFEEYDLKTESERPTYAALAGRHGLKESDVRNYLFSVRTKVRDAISAELAETVASSNDLAAELEAVVQA